jgi:hydroxyacylglutathione hydrolase
MLNGFKTPQQLHDGSQLAFPHEEVVVDVRSAELYGQSHVPGTINIPLEKGFTTWAGWFVPYDKDVWLIAPNEAAARQAARDMAMIGLDRVTGWFPLSAMDGYCRVGGILESFEQTTARELPPGQFLLDVRGRSEWDEGHIEGAHHIPLGFLPQRARELPKDVRIAVHCQGGVRSPIAMSVLRKLGFTKIVDVADGYEGLEAAGYGEAVKA